MSRLTRKQFFDRLSAGIGALFGGWLISACGGYASPTPAHTTPTVTSTSTQARSMKGYELYSWQMQGAWYFSLVVGTNRLKTFEEVSSPEVRMQGIEALKRKLHTLAGGEQVFWLGQRVPGMDWPSDEMVDAIHAYCVERDIQLETDWEWGG